MNLNVIRQRVHNGFQPFAIVTTDDRRFEVPHPNFVAIGRSIVVVLHGNDLSTKIDALHIVSIEDSPAKRRRKSS